MSHSIPTTGREVFLTIADVVVATTVSRSTIYRWVAAGSFPSPMRFGLKTSRWHQVDIDRWVASNRQPAGLGN